jgi:hypothetical protein
VVQYPLPVAHIGARHGEIAFSIIVPSQSGQPSTRSSNSSCQSSFQPGGAGIGVTVGTAVSAARAADGHANTGDSKMEAAVLTILTSSLSSAGSSP